MTELTRDVGERAQCLAAAVLALFKSTAEASNRAAFLPLIDALHWVVRLFAEPVGNSAQAPAAMASPHLDRLIAAAQELEAARRALSSRLPPALLAELVAVENALSRALPAKTRGRAGASPTRSGLSRQTLPGSAGRKNVPAASTGPAVGVAEGHRAAIGATAPSSVRPGEEFVARFVLCAESDLDRLRELLDAIEPASAGRQRSLGAQTLTLPTAFVVRVEPGPGLSLVAGSAPLIQVAWDGSMRIEAFELAVDNEPAVERTRLRFELLIDGLRLGTTVLEISIRANSRSEPLQIARAHLARTAFASYASMDRARVLDRVSAIRSVFDMDVFVDCNDLVPGRAWQPQLAREIASREQFFLFWSSAAARSPWVGWELDQAMGKPGIEHIQLQPLDNATRPPEALKHLHSKDVLNLLRDTAQPQQVTVDTIDLHVKPRTLDDDEFPLGVIRIGVDEGVTYLNRACDSMLGGELHVGQKVSSLALDLPSQKSLKDALRSRFRDERGSGYTVAMRRRDTGTLVRAQIAAVPEYDAQGELRGSIGFVVDQSRRDVTLAIHRHMAGATDVHSLLSAVDSSLREAIDYDTLMVSALGADGLHIRALFEAPAPATPQGFRWWPMPPFVQRMVRELEPGPMDLHALFQQPDWAELAKVDRALQNFIGRDFHHALRMQVTRRGAVAATVTLLRHDDKPFLAADLDLCLELPLLEAVSQALSLEHGAQRRFELELIDDLTQLSGDTVGIGQMLVDRLWDQYRWEHVSLFRVSTDATRIELLCQARDSRLRLPEGYGQQATRGVLGRCRQQGRYQNVAVVRDDPDYTVGVPGVASELVLPFPGETTTWMLNVESGVEAAFADEERLALERILRVAATVFDATCRRALHDAVMNRVRDVVIRTTVNNIIVEVSRSVTALLGQDPKAMVGRSLLSFVHEGSDDGATSEPEERYVRLATSAAQPGGGWRAWVDSAHDDNPARAIDQLLGESGGSGVLEMVRADGSTVRMLVSAAGMPPHVEGKIFIASDLSGKEYVERVEALLPQLREVISDTRVPLTLASSFLEDALASSGESGADPTDAMHCAMTEIARADLAFERVLRVAAASEGSPLPTGTVNLRALIENLLEGWPEDTRRAVRVRDMDAAPPIRAAAAELGFCLRALLSWLLKARGASDVVELRVRSSVRDVFLRAAIVSDEEAKVRLQTATVEPPDDFEVAGALLRRMGGELSPLRGGWSVILRLRIDEIQR